MKKILGFLAFATLTFSSLVASAEPWVEARSGISIFGQAAVGTPAPGTFSYAGSAGYDFGSFRLGGIVEHNIWVVENVSDPDTFFDSVLNIGVLVGYSYFDDFAMTSLAVGTSTLLFPTVATDAGTTGVFVKLDPVGLRFDLTPEFVLTLRPLNFEAMVPVLNAIPLYRLAYSTNVGLEYRF